jgi:hypothetical protein
MLNSKCSKYTNGECYQHNGEKCRREIGGGYIPSQLERTPQLCSYKEWQGECVHPPPSAGWAGFTIMMECTPENGHVASLFVLSRLLLSISVESSLVPLRSSQTYELKRTCSLQIIETWHLELIKYCKYTILNKMLYFLKIRNINV